MKFSRQHRFNERSILLEWPTEPLMEANIAVDALFYFLRQKAPQLLENLCPAYHSLLVVCHTPEDVEKIGLLINQFYDLETSSFDKQSSEDKIIPVCYDPVLGNDLGIMTEKLNLSFDAIIQIHSGTRYYVFMLGFLPGFAYMGVVDERIAMPRKPKPVPTKQGAVGIAGRQTGIYPSHSPGGWHIVGHTPLKMFDTSLDIPVFFQPGNRVKFEPISLEQYLQWDERATRIFT